MKQFYAVDNKLKEAVYRIFDAYDFDKSGILDVQQVLCLINDSLYHIKNLRKVTEEQIVLFIKEVDKDNDGGISRDQLLSIFKSLLGQ